MLAKKFGHLTNQEEEGDKLDAKKMEETEVSNLLDQPTKTNPTTEEQTLLDKTPNPMPIKWRFKLFNMSSNS
jgi:hypothetical protein